MPRPYNFAVGGIPAGGDRPLSLHSNPVLISSHSCYISYSNR